MVAPFAVTRVRYDELRAQPVLRKFVFGGHFGTERPPRGVEPAHLLAFIQREVPEGGEADVYHKVLHAIRFYELSEAVPHLLRTLHQPIVERDDVQRCCYCIQAAADVGSLKAEQLAQLCKFFDDAIVLHPLAPALWPLLFETRVVLAPHGSDAALEARLADEVRRKQAHERDGEAEMMAYDAVAAVQRNELPRAQRCAAGKAELRFETDPQRRRNAMVDTYLGRRHLGKLVEEWAARYLRWEALAHRPDPVWDAFGQAIDAIDRTRLSPAQADLELVRAAQAIQYLGGRLSPEHQRQYEAAHGVASFLWDDP